ncbi:hypothetical protein, partial [Klebsiella aerogenes]|uniref:hypothetical protein n=1 Tax=Klebsiella aerogenes TaxID=548 RepID=UPI001CBE2E01
FGVAVAGREAKRQQADTHQFRYFTHRASFFLSGRDSLSYRNLFQVEMQGRCCHKFFSSNSR